MVRGQEVPALFTPYRSVIAEPDRTSAGNIVLRVGREISAGGWHQTEHVVLTPEEAEAHALDVLDQLGWSATLIRK